MPFRFASLPLPLVAIAALLPPLGASETHEALPAVGLRTDCRSHSNGRTSGAIPTNMVLVPGGSFTMGVPEKLLVKWLESDADTRNAAADHLVACYPDHNQVCEDLLVDKFETSNLQFKTWLDAHGMHPDETTIKLNWSSFKNGKLVEGLPAGQEQNPVRAISADEARGALRWIGKRLPTEVEWAYVATRSLKPDQAYPWGGTFGSWDPTKCANSSNSSRGAAGQQTFPPGSWKEDVTVDGVFDLCGNVCEWTSSPFLQFPGFQPLTIKDNKQKRVLRGRFSDQEVAVRGGSYYGNHITNNTFWRKGELPASRFEAVGFRGVMSAQPGLDALNDAQKALTMLAADFKGRLELTKDGIAGQQLQYVDPETNVVRGAKHIAFTRVNSVLAPIMKVERDSVETPVLLGILTVTAPIVEPNLPAGNYGFYFKGKGASEAQKKAELDAKKGEEEAKKGEKNGKGGDAKKDEKKRDKKNDGKNDKKGDKKDGKDPTDDAKPAEGEAKEEAAPAEEEDPAKKALEAIGAIKAAPVALVDLPKDRAIILIKNEADAIVGFLDAKFVPDQAHHPVRLTYKPGGGSAGKSTAAAGGSPMLVADHDTAKLTFTVKMGTGLKFPQFELAMKFAAGSFEPVDG